MLISSRLGVPNYPTGITLPDGASQGVTAYGSGVDADSLDISPLPTAVDCSVAMNAALYPDQCQRGVPSQEVSCDASGCRGPSVAQLQMVVNKFANSYRFSKLAADGVLGVNTAKALAAIGVGGEYDTFYDLAAHAQELVNLVNGLHVPPPGSTPVRTTIPTKITPAMPVGGDEMFGLPTWAVWGLGLAAVAGVYYVAKKKKGAR